jgi:hypothetical protein
MTITVNPAWPANAGADKFVCGANAVTLGAIAATGGNWTGGAGSFAPIEILPMQFILLPYQKWISRLLLYLECT